MEPATARDAPAVAPFPCAARRRGNTRPFPGWMRSPAASRSMPAVSAIRLASSPAELTTIRAPQGQRCAVASVVWAMVPSAVFGTRARHNGGARSPRATARPLQEVHQPVAVHDPVSVLRSAPTPHVGSQLPQRARSTRSSRGMPDFLPWDRDPFKDACAPRDLWRTTSLPVLRNGTPDAAQLS